MSEDSTVETMVRGIPVHYEQFGEGRPVVLVHGFGLDHHFTVHAFEPLFGNRVGWRRIHVDMPGHGDTPGPDWLTSEDDMLDVLLGFVDAVAPGERLLVIGTSWGAYLALGLAQRRTNLIDGLMLTVPLVRADRATRDLPPRTVVVSDPATVADVQPGEEMWLELFAVQNAETLAAFRAGSEPDATPPDEPFLERLEARYAFSFEDDLQATIEAPALIICGRQDSIVGYRDAWPLLERMPRATFAVLDRAGHPTNDEQPVLVRALGAEWLDRVEEWSASRA